MVSRAQRERVRQWNVPRQLIRCLDGALVGLSRALVLVLVDLVAGSTESARDAVGDGVLSGNVALGLLLVGLLGSLSRVALDGLGDVVGGVGNGVADLTDDTLVGLVGVGSRHFECWGGLVGWCWKR
jgi:hypothetical protein